MATNILHGEMFDDITTFLAGHRWIYDFKLTRIFQDNVLDNMPGEWRETLINMSLSQFAVVPFGSIQPNWPDSFKCFLEKCARFSLPREVTVSSTNQNQECRGNDSISNTCSVHQNCNKTEKCGGRNLKCVDTSLYNSEMQERDFRKVREVTLENKYSRRITPLDPCEVNADIRKGMSEKKLHEVCQMTSLIDHVTRLTESDGVVDVGSGLGYLGQVLHCNYGHSVLGLEGKQGHTTGADRRANKFECGCQLHNVTCELNQNAQSQQEFTSLVTDWFTNLAGSKCSHQDTGSQTKQTDRIKITQTGSSGTQEVMSATSSIQAGVNKCTAKTGYSYNQTGSSMNCLETGNSDNVEKSLTGSSITECLHKALHSELSLPNGLQEIAKSDSEVNDNLDMTQALDSGHSLRQCKDVTQSNKTIEKNHKHTEIGVESSVKPSIPKLCMVGLHCCGDLTPTMLKYFVDIELITSLVCVGCCYHRMGYNEVTQEHDNFPMSMLFKDSLKKTRQKYPDFKFSPYCLRLAAQETRARWREQTEADHAFHMKNVAYRGVLEKCLEQADSQFKMKKSARKLAHKGDYESFMKYTDAVFKHIQIPDQESEAEFKKLFLSTMQRIYDDYHQYFSLIEPLTALQYLLQPVIESLIYLDRQQWLAEHGYHADIVPIFNELTSPRNLALVAYKK